MANKSKLSVLICAEDVSLASLVRDFFVEHHINAEISSNVEDCLEKVGESHYDILITDYSHTSCTNANIIREIRSCGNMIPVISLINKATRSEILPIYKAGGDDYLPKPFAMEVLLCKVKAITSRVNAPKEKQSVFLLGETTYNSVQQTIGGIRLSSRENELLKLLCHNLNETVERSRILKQIWGKDQFFASRSLSVYINHLRKILVHVPGAQIIAEHGKGYKLVVE